MTNAMISLVEATIVLLALGIFSFLSYKRQWLDNEGILIANIVGLAAFLLGGRNALLALFVFFGIGESATYWLKKKKQHSQRTTSNILGNSLASIIALVLASPLGFFAATSTALADTLSSEIGVLSKKKPRLITSFKTVETGEDGAVSLLGLVAAIVGAVIIAALGFGFGLSAQLALVVLVSGFLGSLVDSLFGATLQKRNWVDNNEVNFLACSAGALIAVGIALALGWA